MSNNRIIVPQFKSYVDKSDFMGLEGVFENNYIAEGPFTARFKDQLLHMIKAPFGCFASNGTLALYLALKALDIGPGDEVLVQDITFIASVNAVHMVGAKPVFIDIVSYNNPSPDLDKILLTPRTKAMVIAHLFGTACTNTLEIQRFCNDKGIYLVEDAAQALAIYSQDGHCGTYGDVGTYSFYADKTITTGEGGFVVAKDEAVYEKMLYLRNQGRLKSGTFIHPCIGYNFRITDIQAALGIAQLSKLEYIIQRKTRIYEMYLRLLGEKTIFLVVNPEFTYIPFRVVVFCEHAHEVMSYMSDHGIEARTVFYPLHKQPCYDYLQYTDEGFENSVQCYDKGICLPTWVGLTDEMIELVAATLIEAIKKV